MPTTQTADLRHSPQAGLNAGRGEEACYYRARLKLQRLAFNGLVSSKKTNWTTGALVALNKGESCESPGCTREGP
ncbi:hypothetical protein TgHK011_001352 [Trichoderma gracile]|nr:hypothetical protein TgHK011_001352 [Trichoderma gracile]